MEGFCLFVMRMVVARGYFPGGGIKRGETPLIAARREIKEEVGIEIEELKQVGELYTTAEYKRDTVFVFTAKSKDADFIIDNHEIFEAKWFLFDNLPLLSPYGHKILEMFRKSRFSPLGPSSGK